MPKVVTPGSGPVLGVTFRTIPVDVVIYDRCCNNNINDGDCTSGFCFPLPRRTSAVRKHWNNWIILMVLSFSLNLCNVDPILLKSRATTLVPVLRTNRESSLYLSQITELQRVVRCVERYRYLSVLVSFKSWAWRQQRIVWTGTHSSAHPFNTTTSTTTQAISRGQVLLPYLLSAL